VRSAASTAPYWIRVVALAAVANWAFYVPAATFAANQELLVSVLVFALVARVWLVVAIWHSSTCKPRPVAW
jgi:hypothetical protein